MLRSLLQNRWQRLSSEYDDPLGMLFGNRARQWTAGWSPEQKEAEKKTLFLLVWETDSWQEKPVWSLYRDGQLIFQEEDGFSKSRSGVFHQLLESEALPFLDQSRFLAPLTDFRYDVNQRRQAAQILMRTIQARPEVFERLKDPFLKGLEADANNPDWPVLDILKLHRVAHKTVLVDLARQCVTIGLFRTQEDWERLDSALRQLEAEFAFLGQTISGLFAPALQEAQDEFTRILMDGDWRIQLQTGTRRPSSGMDASGFARPI